MRDSLPDEAASIRPGWFYHPEEDGRVKSLDEVQRIYDGAVGGNACFLLNLPPAPRGLIHEADTARMRDFGNALRARFARNLAANGRATADVPSAAGHEASRPEPAHPLRVGTGLSDTRVRGRL
ncbi:MAG: hypothetical protein AAB152_08905 [Candidatus Coatesbacteria bacterium]